MPNEYWLFLPLRQTPWHVIQNERYTALTAYQSISTRFQVLFNSPLGVLFSFPSRYWCAIGLRNVFRVRSWCLLASHLESSRCYSRYCHTRSTTPTGLSPFIAPLSRGLRVVKLGFKRQSYKSTSQSHLTMSGSDCPLLLSLAANNSILGLVSLPPGTETFQFPGSR